MLLCVYLGLKFEMSLDMKIDCFQICIYVLFRANRGEKRKGIGFGFVVFVCIFVLEFFNVRGGFESKERYQESQIMSFVLVFYYELDVVNCGR